MRISPKALRNCEKFHNIESALPALVFGHK